MRRSLVDLTDRIVTLLHQNTTAKQDQKEVGSLPEDCISAWIHFKTAIKWVRQQLKAVVS